MNLAIVLLATAATGFGWWRLSLRLWPYARCRRCNRSGTNWGSDRDRWGPCRKCGGSGKRRRLGAGKAE